MLWHTMAQGQDTAIRFPALIPEFSLEHARQVHLLAQTQMFVVQGEGRLFPVKEYFPSFTL
jgi:hypothetical protein